MIKKDSVKDVLRLALPAVSEMILYMMIGVLDTVMIGQFGGKISVSAVGLGSEIIYTFANIFIAVGVTVAITSLVARKFGAKEMIKGELYANTGFFIGSLIALFISLLLFFFSKNILNIAGATEDVILMGSLYIRVCSIGIFFSMLMSMLNGILRGLGNTKFPLLASILINLINITFDYILIFGKFGLPSLGVLGAAIATSFAQIVGFFVVFIYIQKKSPIKINLLYLKNIKRRTVKNILKLSIPSSLQEAAFSISRLINTFMIISMSTTAFAANQITTTIESLSFMPGWGFAVAATTLVGHKIGEKNHKKAKEYASLCIILGIAIMSFCGIIFLMFPNLLIRLFINAEEKQVIHLGSLCLMVASIEQPFMAVSMIVGGSFKGYGDTKTPFLVSVFSSWFIRLPLMYFVIYVLKASVIYVWWVTAFQWAIDASLIYFLFYKKFKGQNI